MSGQNILVISPFPSIQANRLELPVIKLLKYDFTISVLLTPCHITFYHNAIKSSNRFRLKGNKYFHLKGAK